MLKLDQRTKTKAAWVATLLSPLIAVQGVRYLVIGEASPVSAGAAVSGGQMMPATAAEAAKPLTAAQTKAAQWLASRTVALNLRSPMDMPDPVAPTPMPEPVVKVPEAPTPAPKDDDTPHHLVLTSILGGAGESSRSLASINHRIYRVGDEVAPGWRLSAIDSKKREIVLSNSDGRSLTLTPPQR